LHIFKRSRFHFQICQALEASCMGDAKCRKCPCNSSESPFCQGINVKAMTNLNAVKVL